MLFAIIGCAVLLVVGVPCVIGIFFMLAGAGAGAYTMSRPVAVSPPTSSYAVAPPPGSGAIVGSNPAMPADPRDAAFAAYVIDASRAIESAARGQPHDARWDAITGGDDLRRVAPDNAATLAPLGAWTVVATALEVESITPAPGGSGYVRSNVIVFPDGRVRWVSIDARVRPEVFVRPTVGLAMAAPPLASEADRMIAALRDPACSLPIASAYEMTGFPPALARVTATGEIMGACRTVANLGAATAWQPRFDDVTLLVRGNGLWATVRSGFEVSGGRMTLSSARARAMR